MAEIVNLNIEPNPDAKLSAFQHVSKFTTTSIGALRTIQATRNICRGVNATRELAGRAPSKQLTQIDSALGIGISALSIPRIPSVTQDAIKSVADLGKKSSVPGAFRRKIIKATHDMADMLAIDSYAVALATSIPVLRTVGSTFDLVADAADIEIHGENILRSKKLEKAIAKETNMEPDEKKRALKTNQETKNFDIMKFAKGVLATLAGVLGLVVFAMGAPLLPAIIFAIMALATVTLAISSQLYKQSRPNLLIDHSVVHVTA
ncbi:MAG TPA: hypothetical protein VLE89_02075 [Chlamydiales bacterium]|nr:hypothetical protein [Chlamydiales bacterium]